MANPLASDAARRTLAIMNLTAIVERDAQTGLLIGSVPGIPGAHSSGASMEELQTNLEEVLALLKDQGELKPESVFVGTLQVAA